MLALTVHVFVETKRILVLQLAVPGQEAFRSHLAVLLHRAPVSPSPASCWRMLLQHPGGTSSVPPRAEVPSLCGGCADGCSPLGYLSGLFVGEGAVFWVSSALLLLFGLLSYK